MTPAELNETERRVAVQVAYGRTNREVAERLQLSVKTIEWNLTKIYRKLGVRSRTELAITFRGLTTADGGDVGRADRSSVDRP